MPRAVLDTNILVSATFWPGKPHQVLLAAAEGRYDAYTSPAILNEYKHVLNRDFLLSEGQTDAILQTVLEALEVVEPGMTVSVVREDPDDDRIIECALEAKANYIVSGDSHLLKLGKHGSVQIVTASQFLQLLG